MALPPGLDALFEAARAAREAAYAPYSRFHVGAAILTASGAIHSGGNVENAAYPIGNCAEASAIAAMVRAGERRIAAILVIGPNEALCFPCGGCRQRIREFAGPETVIHVARGDGSGHETFSIEDLLPRSFGPADLGLGERP
jgi:cytidine deaminase